MAYREPAEIETTEVDAYLGEGEEVLFLRHPRQGVIFRKHDFVIIPFMTVWTGFAAIWTIGASMVAGAFGLLGLPFLGVGAYGLFGRFYMNAKKRKETVYALTNQRLLIKAGSSLTSLPLENLFDIGLRESKDGGGTITIRRPQQLATETGHELHLESDVREFYGAIMEAKMRAKKTAKSVESPIHVRVAENPNTKDSVSVETESDAAPLQRKFKG